MKENHLLLYTFRRCPYAIRARMALTYAGLKYQQQEVDLKQKPESLFQLSPKGTVPVLKINSDLVLEESLDIMYWALSQQDPEHWLAQNATEKKQFDDLIQQNDQEFKSNLDRYKYPDRFSDSTQTQADYFQAALAFLKKLETLLSKNKFLFRSTCSIADVALFPFIRQCYYVDEQLFSKFNLKHLEVWLNAFLNSDLFRSVMCKKDE